MRRSSAPKLLGGGGLSFAPGALSTLSLDLDSVLVREHLCAPRWVSRGGSRGGSRGRGVQDNIPVQVDPDRHPNLWLGSKHAAFSEEALVERCAPLVYVPSCPPTHRWLATSRSRVWRCRVSGT